MLTLRQSKQLLGVPHISPPCHMHESKALELSDLATSASLDAEVDADTETSTDAADEAEDDEAEAEA